jgi:hypothetical protein
MLKAHREKRGERCKGGQHQSMGTLAHGRPEDVVVYLGALGLRVC